MASRYDLFLPNSPTTLLQGESCGKCGETLPDTLVYHIVAPSSTPEIRAAAVSGMLNSCRCSYCDFLGFFTAAALVVLPERNRQIFIIPRCIIIPNVKPVKQNLYRLGGQHNLVAETCLKLPSQEAESCFNIPDRLETPDDAVEYEQLAEDQAVARLLLTPEKRAVRFVADQVEQVERQLARLNNTDVTNEELPPITNLAFMSPFERTNRMLRAILLEFDKQIALHADGNISRCLAYLRDDLRASYTKKEEEIQNEPAVEPATDVAEVLTALDAVAHVARSSDSIVGTRELLPLIDRFHILGENEIALDLAKYCLHQASPESASHEDFEAILRFGILVELTESWPKYDSMEYLILAASHLPARGQSDNAHALFRGAVARKFLAGCYRREHRQHAALAMLVEAAELYLDIGYLEEARSEAENAVLISQELGDRGGLQRAQLILSQVADNASSEPAPVPGAGVLAEVQTQIDTIRQSGIDQIRHMVFNFLPPGKEWDGGIIKGHSVPYGSVVMQKIPVNYDPEHQLSLYGARTADIEGFGPYDQTLIEYLESDESGINPDSITIRLWEREGDDLALRGEQIIKHPLLTWVKRGKDEEEQLARDRIMRPNLWQWAGEHQRAMWLLAEYATRIIRARESDEPLSFAEKIGFGLGFAGLSHDARTHGKEHQHWLANKVIELLGELTGSDDGLLDEKVSLGTACEIRRSLALSCEVTGDVGRALKLYEINVRAALFARKGGTESDSRERVQSLAGADVGRYIRAALRRNEWRLSDAELKRIFLLGEVTSSRFLTERYLTATSPDASGQEGEAVGGQRGTAERDMTEYAEDALADSHYTQLILITSHDNFEGSWVALTPTGRGAPLFRKIEWNTPLAVYNKIDKLYSYHASMRNFARKQRREIINGFHDAKSWVATVIGGPVAQGSNVAEQNEGRRVAVRCQSYLIGFPWSFLCSLLNFENPNNSTNLPSIVSAFSYASLRRAEELESHLIEQRKLAVFLDPLGDLPEVRHLASRLPSGPNGVEKAVFIGTQVTAPRILEHLHCADCIVYIGHGRQARELETTGIIGSFGKEIRDSDIERANIQGRRTTQVAVIMACWGGAGAVTRSIHSWESRGLSYSLKQAGFDYIVASLWPISPRMATSYVEYFLDEWSKEQAIATSVSTAYQRLIEKYGIETVMIEGSGIQLMA